MLVSRLLALAFTGAVCAQGTITVPAGVVNRDGTNSLVGAGFVTARREQFLFGPSHLGAVAGRDVTALRLRRDGFVVEQAAGRVNLTVTVSSSTLLDVRSPSPVFAQNHRVPATTVFQGVLDLPFSPRLPHPHAATWAAQDAVTIPFAVPFRYSAGALCVQLDGTPDATLPSTRWSIDAERDPNTGTAIQIGQGCGPFASWASETAGVEPSLLRVGSTPRFVGIGQPGSPAFLFLSAQVLTPGIDLTFLGAPGCVAYVLPDASVSAIVGPGVGGGRPGGADVQMTLPTQAGMVGATMYAQWAILAGAALTTTNALQLQLAATASSLDGSVVVSKPVTGAMLPTTGAIDVATMAVVQFDYQ